MYILIWLAKYLFSTKLLNFCVDIFSSCFFFRKAPFFFNLQEIDVISGDAHPWIYETICVIENGRVRFPFYSIISQRINNGWFLVERQFAAANMKSSLLAWEKRRNAARPTKAFQFRSSDAVIRFLGNRENRAGLHIAAPVKIKGLDGLLGTNKEIY